MQIWKQKCSAKQESLSSQIGYVPASDTTDRTSDTYLIANFLTVINNNFSAFWKRIELEILERVWKHAAAASFKFGQKRQTRKSVTSNSFNTKDSKII